MTHSYPHDFHEELCTVLALYYASERESARHQHIIASLKAYARVR